MLPVNTKSNNDPEAPADLERTLEDLLHNMHIPLLDVVAYCERRPRWWCVLLSILSDHGINLFFHLREDECFTQPSNKSANVYQKNVDCGLTYI